MSISGSSKREHELEGSRLNSRHEDDEDDEECDSWRTQRCCEKAHNSP